MQRSTVRLDDDLLQALKERAHREATSVTKLINQAIRDWLAGRTVVAAAKRKPFRQRTFDTGVPLFDVTQANALAAQLEDEEIIAKLRQGK